MLWTYCTFPNDYIILNNENYFSWHVYIALHKSQSEWKTIVIIDMYFLNNSLSKIICFSIEPERVGWFRSNLFLLEFSNILLAAKRLFRNIYIAFTSYGRVWPGGISSKSFLQQLTECVSVRHLHGPWLQRFHRSTPDIIVHTADMTVVRLLQRNMYSLLLYMFIIVSW